MTKASQRPKAKKQLNWFKQEVRVVDITHNGLERYILAIELERGTITGAKQTLLVQVSKEVFECKDNARQALMTKNYSLPEELKSYLLQSEQLKYEGSNVSVTMDEVLVEEGVDVLSYVIGNRLVSYNDEGPNGYSFNTVVSQESWKTKEQAQQALDSGDWTRISEWDLTNHYLDAGPLKVEYNKWHKGFVYCREIQYRDANENSKVMVDYLECSPRGYETEDEALQVLKEYLEKL